MCFPFILFHFSPFYKTHTQKRRFCGADRQAWPGNPGSAVTGDGEAAASFICSVSIASNEQQCSCG